MPRRDDGVKAWERQKDESAKAYEAFFTYLNMGQERSVRAVAQRLSKSATLIARWSVKHEWQERLRAYDQQLQRDAYKKAVKQREAMQERHIKTAVLMQKKAVEALDNLDITALSAKDIISLIKNGSTLERETRGEDAVIVAQEKKQDTQSGGSGLADAITAAWEKRKEGVSN